MEFSTLMEDWDLQAVVRSGGSSSSSDDHQFGSGFSNIFNSPGFDDQDHDDIFNTFQFDFDCINYDHDEKKEIVSTSCSSTSLVCVNPSCSSQVKEPEKLPKKSALSSSLTLKSKKRRNQQKRVVKHVAADGIVSSDLWAWRKYGQKPIKGSPYPRSYYRCSSLKGCLARKQVERSSEDPSLFIITYTADHSHAHPTRRNSLAGSTRNKLLDPNMPKQTLNPSKIIKHEISNNILDTLPNVPSTSTSTPNSVDDLVQHVMSTIKNEQLDQEDQEEGRYGFEYNISEISNEIGMPDLIFSDDLFPSFEEFEGIFLDNVHS